MSRQLISRWWVLAVGLLMTCCLNSNKVDRNARGYLAATDQGIMFIQFTEQQGHLSGRIQSVSVEEAGLKRIEAKDGSLTGVREGTNVSLCSAEFFEDSAVAGNLSDNSLSLALPQPNGTLATVEFKSATLQEYNKDVESLNEKIDHANGEARASQAANSSRREAELKGHAQGAYIFLNEQIKYLAATPQFDEAVSLFNDHWREMQAHEKLFREKAGSHPLTRDRLDEARFALQQLGYDRQLIGSDREQLDSIIRDTNQRIAHARDALADLRAAGQARAAASPDDAADSATPDSKKDDITDLTGRTETEIKKVEDAIENAQSQAGTIEQQADETYKKAQELYGQLRIEK